MYAHAQASAAPDGAPSPTSPSSSSSTTAWTTPGPAAFDFRSDTITTPTASMLGAITGTTLMDDMYVEDPTTNNLEAFCAQLTGHAAALFVLSGTMGNQVALRTHLTGPPHAILCDARCHIMNYEAGGVASWSGALAQAVHPANGHHLTLADVQAHAVLGDDIHACPTRVVCLENTLNGTVMPLAEVQRIGAWCREQGIVTHMDGARLWEAAAQGAGSLEAYASAVDSVSLCFSKGLGAPMGSVLVGSAAFVKRARWIRKGFGGATRQAGVVTAAARAAIDDTYLSGKLKETQGKARAVADMWLRCGGQLQFPTETNMVWFDLEAAGVSTNHFIEAASKHGLRTMGGRLVVHYQISEEAIQKLEVLARELLQGKVTHASKQEPPVNAEDMKADVC